EGDGEILAFDIINDNFHAEKDSASMPEEASFFLYDASGNLMYYNSLLDEIEHKDFIDQLYIDVKNGIYDPYDAVFMDTNGEKRGVYYAFLDNGWAAVMTIPTDRLLHGDMDSVMYMLVAMSASLLIGLAGLIIYNFFKEQRNRYINETLKILGNTYYAIYRINYENETYQTIKCNNDMVAVINSRGHYRDLIKAIKSKVEERTYEEFERSFSIENIKSLIAKEVYDFGGDFQRKFADGYHWVSIHIIYSQQLGINEVLMCFKNVDIEKRKKLDQYRIMENALEISKQATTKKNIFFSNVSHDMRTPLNAIIGLSNLALEHKDDQAKVEDYLQKISKSGDQLLNLINDILDISKMEQGGGNALNYKQINLDECIKENISLFKDTCSQSNKHLEYQCHAKDLNVFADDFRLKQVLNNLISNAIKYSYENASIKVTLNQIEQKSNIGKYQIIVEDNGIGMTKEFLKIIFEPFAQETMFRPTNVTGTGLGMSIVKGIIQQMSGDIAVESEVGKGSKFTVTLPLKIAENKRLEVKVADDAKIEYDLKGKNILLVEDNEINMEIAKEMLEMFGANVKEAWNGLEAVEIFTKSQVNEIDLILMDMQMPQLDGCGATRTIRSLNRSDAKTVMIIALTANAFAEDIAATSAAGMNGHISKPIDFKQLLKTIDGIAAHK
ncbi:MAG: ATP-binding protein, partial [Erysipelotrichaceae bacterium]|nr:ATP-binding protein [Erysipelotrichaceae bacterium]